MKNKAAAFFAFVFLLSQFMYAIPAAITKHIKIDQFGYLPAGKKVAVIVDPQTGYNSGEFFTPGTGVNQYQVRNWTTDAVVFTGTLVAWKAGITHTQSGDRGWWFDFSTVINPGSYYIFDVANNVGSYRFEIGNDVYSQVLKQAVRMYFYQRINYAKQPPYVDAKWADAAAFEGANQDRFARSRFDKTNPATARDVHGGWMDAGDYNKYVTFTLSPLCNLLETYRMHPTLFTDDYNIPESGNSVPDVLDEVQWEFEWLKRMQNATGTNGLFLKVGADNYNAGSPPSTDNNARYYLPECTSSTLTGCAVFALGGIVYKSLGSGAMIAYGDDLLTRASNAWNRAKATTNNFNVFQTACDDQHIVAGDADVSADDQKEMVITAAAYLFEATGSSEYKNCFDTMYTKARAYANWWWGPYYSAVQKALLRYSALPAATASVANNIRSRKAAQNGVLSINDYNNQTDLYRSFMPDAQYHWNSHEVKANAGLNNYDFVTFNVNTPQRDEYKETAESYLHWFHGVNPMGKVFLTNMYAYGGDSCVNEFYHSWFGNGTVWDNVFTSPNGPPPGYVPGGPNKDFSIPTISPPAGQPPQKSYKEWNTGWNGSANENSWEITEAGIYTQAAYISLLVRVAGNTASAVLPLHILSLNAKRTDDGAIISWEVSHSNDSRQFELQRSFNGTDFTAIQAVNAAAGQKIYTEKDFFANLQHSVIYYRIKETDKQGSVFYSPVVKLSLAKNVTLQVYPIPARDQITVTGYQPKQEILMLKIFDAKGRLVLTQNWQQPAGNFSKTIPLTSLGKGAYWLSISGEKGTRIKIVKQ